MKGFNYIENNFESGTLSNSLSIGLIDYKFVTEKLIEKSLHLGNCAFFHFQTLDKDSKADFPRISRTKKENN